MIDEIREATLKYPRFADGRIDYTDSYACYAVNCVVMCGDAILVTRRGSEVIAYPNTISGISGFIDNEMLTLEETVRNELAEEVRAPLEKMTRLVVGEKIVQVDNQLKREWHVYPALAEFSEIFVPDINWENSDAKWIPITDLHGLQLMPGFPDIVSAALVMRQTKKTD